MIVGWSVPTQTGIRLYESKRGRYFRDVASSRCRERLILKVQMGRSGTAVRRESYWLNYKHLDGARIAVRIGNMDAPGAA